MRGLLVVLGLAVASPANAASLAAERIVIVGRAGPGQPYTDGATLVRLGDDAELAVVVVAREGRRGRRVTVADDEVSPLELGGHRVKPADRRRFGELGQVAVEWFRVEPNAWREPGTRAPNGATSDYHSNVATEGAHFGAWLGYDAITYYETSLGAAATTAAARRVAARATPSHADEDRFGGLGTMRYRVALTLADGRVLDSPGKDAVDTYGILPTVHRVSVRADDTIRGWLTAYFLVPEVFGSAGPGKNHQTERFTGADCADVLIGAVRRAGYLGARYTSVAALGQDTDSIHGAVDLDDAGRPAEPIADAAVGDLIRIDYGGSLSHHTPRAWDHVAMWYEDRSDPAGPARGGPDGLLDGFDLVVHMGHPRLAIEPLAGQAPARIDVLRFAPAKLGRRARGQKVSRPHRGG